MAAATSPPDRSGSPDTHPAETGASGEPTEREAAGRPAGISASSEPGGRGAAGSAPDGSGAAGSGPVGIGLTGVPAEVNAVLPGRRVDGTDVAGLGRGRAAAFVAPALALIAVFLVFPAVWTLYLGITDYRLTGRAAKAPRNVGVSNYTDALTDPRFRNALVLTLLFVFGSAIVGQTVLGFTLAWTLRSARGWLRAVLETLILLAWILPSSVVAFLWIAFLARDGGTLNRLLGTPGKAWLVDHPMASIIVFNTWRGTAFSLLLFGAALGSVPPSQLETARLAGASVLGQLRDVVFPHIRGHLLTNTLLISLWTFNDFTPYLITAGGPNRRSETLPVYIYDVAIYDGRLGFGSAISLIMLVINLVIALFYLRLLRERRS